MFLQNNLKNPAMYSSVVTDMMNFSVYSNKPRMSRPSSSSIIMKKCADGKYRRLDSIKRDSNRTGMRTAPSGMLGNDGIPMAPTNMVPGNLLFGFGDGPDSRPGTQHQGSRRISGGTNESARMRGIAMMKNQQVRPSTVPTEVLRGSTNSHRTQYCTQNQNSNQNRSQVQPKVLNDLNNDANKSPATTVERPAHNDHDSGPSRPSTDSVLSRLSKLDMSNLKGPFKRGEHSSAEHSGTATPSSMPSLISHLFPQSSMPPTMYRRQGPLSQQANSIVSSHSSMPCLVRRGNQPSSTTDYTSTATLSTFAGSPRSRTTVKSSSNSDPSSPRAPIYHVVPSPGFPGSPRTHDIVRVQSFPGSPRTYDIVGAQSIEQHRQVAARAAFPGSPRTLDDLGAESMQRQSQCGGFKSKVYTPRAIKAADPGCVDMSFSDKFSLAILSPLPKQLPTRDEIQLSDSKSNSLSSWIESNSFCTPFPTPRVERFAMVTEDRDFYVGKGVSRPNTCIQFMYMPPKIKKLQLPKATRDEKRLALRRLEKTYCTTLNCSFFHTHHITPRTQITFMILHEKRSIVFCPVERFKISSFDFNFCSQK